MNSSYPRRLADHPAWRQMTEKRIESARFREEFPVVDADWEEALNEDEHRTYMERRKREDERLAMDLPDKLVRAGTPRRCADALSMCLRETSALTALRGFMGDDTTFCLLLGAAGVGKSVAASWAVSTVIFRDDGRRGWRGRFVRAADLSRRSLYDRDAQEDFAHLCVCRLLVLDDMGTEQSSSPWAAQLDELVDRRYGDRLKTIFTTNLDADKFKLRYGERIADRIRHDGQVVGAGTESLRRPQQ